MKHKKNIVYILMISFCLPILGFIIELGERTPDIVVNIKDITLMTILTFVFFSIIYLIMNLMIKMLRQ